MNNELPPIYETQADGTSDTKPGPNSNLKTPSPIQYQAADAGKDHPGTTFTKNPKDELHTVLASETDAGPNNPSGTHYLTEAHLNTGKKNFGRKKTHRKKSHKKKACKKRSRK